MVNLLRSQQLMELRTVSVDVGLEDQTTMNPWLCFSCYRFFPDSMIDVASGECLHCVSVGGEGEEGENELGEMD